MGADPQKGCKLACCDLDGRGGDETRDDGVAQKVGEKPQPQSPMATSMSPETVASRYGRPQVLRCSLGCNGPAAAAVMRLATATGPTASAREVPKIA